VIIIIIIIVTFFFCFHFANQKTGSASPLVHEKPSSMELIKAPLAGAGRSLVAQPQHASSSFLCPLFSFLFIQKFRKPSRLF
jgi:hypothetical protein